MGIQLQIEKMPGYLAARFTGAGAIEETWLQYGLIAEHCKRANKNKLLLDFTNAQAEVSFLDRYFLGDEAQIFARYKLQIAVVDRPERVDPKMFGVMVAQNRGVNVLGFTNVEDAVEWLLK